MASDDKGEALTGPTTSSLGPQAASISQRLRNVAAAAQPALDRLETIVQQKLSGVPPERVLPPPATIAAPSALQYALLGEGDEVAELREMFENLLAASMDRDTAAGAHPAFVSMISQLTPDEARILKSIDRENYMLFTTVATTIGGWTGASSLRPDGHVLQFVRETARTVVGLARCSDRRRHRRRRRARSRRRRPRQAG